MSIKDDIKQSSFKSEYQKAIINLLFTHNYLINRMNNVFKRFNITRQQFNVLRILRGQHPKPASINLIKDRMLDKMSDASRIVERLRIKGLITRTQNLQDRRAVDIIISEKGLELLDKMESKVDSFEDILQGLEPEEATQLNTLLDRIRNGR